MKFIKELNVFAIRALDLPANDGLTGNIKNSNSATTDFVDGSKIPLKLMASPISIITCSRRG